MTDAFNPTTTFVHLEPDGRAEPIPVTPQFWDDLTTGRRAADGWLVTRTSSLTDWTQWEMHPAGEEVILLTAGIADIVLEAQSSEEGVRLTVEQPMLIVPRGIWHTARVVEPATMTFITFGKDTQHRAIEQVTD